MEYLEAIAIKMLRPDKLPGHLQHLPAEADRIIARHAAMLHASNQEHLDKDHLKFILPILSREQIAQVNAVLLHNLALAMGLLECWGGPKKLAVQEVLEPLRPVEVQTGEPERALPQIVSMPLAAWEVR